MIEWGDAEEHDVVLVDERGTGEGHRLDCPPRGSDDNLEGYLNGPFDPEAARVCHEELRKKYDLSQDTTPNFADDIDEIRAAMGYDKINLNARSFLEPMPRRSICVVMANTCAAPTSPAWLPFPCVFHSPTLPMRRRRSTSYSKIAMRTPPATRLIRDCATISSQC